jgi:hypothetical protein
VVDLAKAESGNIPPSLSLSNPELAYDVWVLWMATGRRFLPSQLMQEPSVMLDDILQLDGLFNALKDLQQGNEDD